ncbi:MAG: anaerobic glycerol-3-phosphate dehydrogenase subunit C [Bacillota bacterium]
MMSLYDACLKCNLCELHCPVLRVNPAFPGPKNGGPGLERLRAAGRPVDESGLDLCLGCRTCEVVCPSGIKPATLIAAPKAEKVRRKGLPLRDWLLTRTDLLGAVGVRTAPLTNGAMRSRPVRYALEKGLRISRHKPFPRYQQGSFRDWFARRPDPWEGRTPPNGSVAYFHGCSANAMEQHIARQAVAILEHNGFRVILPEQRCCGLPLLANGDREEAGRWARYNLEHLLPHARSGVPVLFTSTSCSLTMKEDYPHLLGSEEARSLASGCWDIAEFLLALHQEGRLRLDFREVRLDLPYHQPCHQRAHGIGIPALTLLRLIPGVRTWNLNAGCCGASGTYGFKAEKYETAMAVGAPLKEAILAVDAPRVLSDCETCRWQIEHLTAREAVHPITVLYEAYGLDKVR